MSISKKIVLTSAAPAPIGPYSQAVDVGPFVFCSGQIPLDPVSGQIVGGDVETQTRQVLKNVEAVLKAAGLTFGHVVKTTIFLKSMDEFPKVNEVYGSVFTGETPARSTVEVARLPKDVRVEIEVLAYRGGAASSKSKARKKTTTRSAKTKQTKARTKKTKRK